MEQLRHRLTNVSPKGQRRSVDQNTLKRTDLDDFVNCYFGGTSAACPPGRVSSKAGTAASPPAGNRHDRKPTWSEKNEKGPWRAYDYEELIKRDNLRSPYRTCPASLDTLEVSVPPAVMLAAASAFPRHLLAQRRKPRRQRQPPRPGGHRRRHRRRSGSRAGAIRYHRRRFEAVGTESFAHVPRRDVKASLLLTRRRPPPRPLPSRT